MDNDDRLPDEASSSDVAEGAGASEPSAKEIVERLNRLWNDVPDRQADIFPSLAGYQLGRYTIDRAVGRGAFGVVYKAYDRQLDRDVALKIPRPEVLLDKEKLRRFESEAHAAARLEHPSIVPVFEADLVGPTPYIATAYCAGPNMAQWTKDAAAPATWKDAVQLIAQLATAVQHAHEQGVVHRDLKPSNVMLVPEGDDPAPGSLSNYQPRLTDFGLARLAESNFDDTGSSLLLGTPLYMAPEQLDRASPANLSAAIDVYSLGVMLFELLSGRLPIDGGSYVQVVDRLREAPPERLKKLRPDLSKELDAICAKCLEKDPAARYSSAAELANDLNSHLRGESVSVRPTSPWDRFRYWRAQPQRIRDAGWFTLCTQTVLATWLAVLPIAITRFDILSRDEYYSTMIEVVQVLATVHLPMIFIAWKTLQGRRWAIWVGFMASLPSLLFPILGAAGVVPVFPFVYRNAAYHAFAAISLICFAMALQLLLYSFAVLAMRKIKDNEQLPLPAEAIA